MKRLFAIIFLAGAVFVAEAASQLTFQVPTNGVMVLPKRNMGRSEGAIWTPGATVHQGDILRWGTSHYMVQTEGVLGPRSPNLVVPGVETNGTAVLRYVEKGSRLGFIVQLDSTGPVRVALNAASEPGSGLMLVGENAIWQESGRGVPQNSIWLVSDSGTNTVTVLEW